MSGNTNPTQAEPTDESTDGEGINREMGRREAIQVGGAALASVAMMGTATAQSDTEGEAIAVNFGSDYAHDPWINGTVTVSEHEGDMSTLEYVDDNGEVADLGDEGFVLAGEPEADDTPHNPVSIMASDFHATEDGNRERLDEYAAFPRGVTYDDDADSSTDEVGVSILDATHWAVDNSGSSGTLSVTDGVDGALDLSIGSQTSGDVATATFDLTSVGSSDATITSGVLRKFVQVVADLDSVPSGVTVDLALTDSTGGEVVFKLADPDGDGSTDAVMFTGTGDSQVAQGRVGEIGSIENIETIEIRVKDAAFSATIHGFNAERESEWVFGSQETQTTNDDGETIVETVDVVEPAGAFGITDLDTLAGTPFETAAIASVEYDAEMRASELPDAQIMARIKDTPDTYSRPKEAEVVAMFDAPTAYSLGVNFENFLVDVALPSGRYLGAEVATGVPEIEDWEDVDGVSWTSRTDAYSSVGSEVELLASVAASDRSATRHRYLLGEDEANALKAASGGSAVVMASGGGGVGGKINMAITAVVGFLGAGVVWFRKDILGLLAR